MTSAYPAPISVPFDDENLPSSPPLVPPPVPTTKLFSTTPVSVPDSRKIALPSAPTITLFEICTRLL